ncbi:MAG: hypothetical protein HY875_12590 [Chloroflexi bacterium]|nr:hypothetical protein [Chloroflexota bacterium]
MHILSLEQVGDGDRALAGGKGLSLARLARAGFPVPPAFVLTTTATAASDASGAIPPDLRDEVVAAWQALVPGGEPVAVRSSAVAEDSAGASFAGQHETILNVTGEPALFAAIEACAASLHSEAAVAYRARAGQPHDEARIAVVVQRMVPATAAGVAFSADPVTGDAGRAIVEAVAGTGEALVAGTAEADRWVFERPSLALLESHHPAGPVLGDGAAREAAAAAIRAEHAFAAPQDIEFAFESNTFWMLQSRPITTSGAPSTTVTSEFDSETTPDELWTSANIQEVLPGLLTPLSMTLFAASAHRAYTATYQRFKLLDKDEWPRFVGMFSNRAFVNVNATRAVAERSFGGDPDAVEHRFLGGEYQEKPKIRWSWKLLRHRLRSALPLTRFLFTAQRRGDECTRISFEWQRRVNGDDPAAMTDAAIQQRRDELLGAAADIVGVHLAISGVAASGFELISRTVQPLLGDETEGRVPALFTGMSGVESAQIGLDMWALSRAALAAGLGEAIRHPGFDPAANDLPASWRDAFARFIDRHGHRGLNEMEASAPSWRLDPAPVVAMAASYLDIAEDHSPPRTLERQAKERQQLTDDLAARMNPVKRRVFRWMLGKAQGWVALREQSKSAVVRTVRLGDHYVPEIQRRLVERGIIDRPDDIFFLAEAELSAALLGTDRTPRQDAIARRRREFERNRHVVLPERFQGYPVPIEPAEAGHVGDVLRGTPVSPGMVTGRARVIFDPGRDGPLLPGEVLVAPVTDAGWTPLFALASALVVDIGSTLSHGSTVAREYGLPAVANVRTGTRTIRTGDLVSVNGSKGTVTVLERAPEAG